MLALPGRLDADWIRHHLPPLQVVQVSAHQLEVIHPDQPLRVLTLKLPHQDFLPEAVVRFGHFKQIFRISEGQGRVEEVSMWEDESNSWPATWETWVARWLECLQAGDQEHWPSLGNPSG